MARVACVLLSMALGAGVQAQTPESALAGNWVAVCSGAAPGSDLALRCAEILAGGPGSFGFAGAGNFLDELPGQGRSATRDGRANSTSTRRALLENVSVFFSAELSRLDRKNSLNEAAFDGDAHAATAGIDWAPSSHWLLGGALTHNRETLDYDASGGSSRGRYVGVLGFATWHPTARLSVDAYLGRLSGENDLRRAIDYSLLSGVRTTALATAAPESKREMFGAGLGWSVPRGAWQWQVGVGVDVMRTTLDAYQEAGGEGLALRVPQRRIETRRGRTDASLSHTVSTGWGVWQPQLQVGWRHEFANPSRRLTVSFAQDLGATPIAFDTEDPDSDWAEVALGNVFTFKHGHSAFLQYRQRIGHAFLQDRVLAIGWHSELH